MPGPIAAGSFTTGSTASTGGVASDVCNPPSGKTSMKLTLTGLDASNTVKTQKRTAPSGPFVDQVTYNSNQSAASIAVTSSEEWRLVVVAMQAIREIRYVLDAQ